MEPSLLEEKKTKTDTVLYSDEYLFLGKQAWHWLKPRTESWLRVALLAE